MTVTLEQVSLSINFDFSYLQEYQDFDPSDWFYVKSTYDGFEQIWIIRSTGTGDFITHCVLHEDHKCNGYTPDFCSNDKFSSLEEAKCSIPGRVHPLFKGCKLPAGKVQIIKDFRSHSHSTYSGTFYHENKGDDVFDSFLDVVTHGVQSDTGSGFHSFEYDEYLDDVQEWFKLSDKEREFLWDFGIAQLSGMGFALCFEPAVHSLCARSSADMKSLRAIQKKVLKSN